MSRAMRILSWNYQGLRNLWTVQSLHKLVREQAPDVCFLMETRLDRSGFEKHCGDVPFKNKLIVKKPNSGGGLALLWKEKVTLDVINFTDNHILAKVVENDGFVWHLTRFYGWPEANEKRKSWALLSHLRTFVEVLGVALVISMLYFMLRRNRVSMHLTLIRWRIFRLLWKIVS